MAQDQDARWEGGGAKKRVPRVRGLELPGLKRWRIRRYLTQGELAQRVGVPQQYISRLEQGRRGCRGEVAQKLAEVLEVDLQALEADSDAKDFGTRYLHMAYLKILLERVVGSAYAVLDERELESYSEKLSVGELVEVISKRRRELEFLEGLLAEAKLLLQMRLFLEELVRERPAEDIRILAARRSRERSEEGRERLTRAMREFL
jgi:transcriptional regulator with XRE-family HTH domain